MAEVANALRAPLDVIVVRKLGVPVQPQLAMGAIGEGGARVVNTDIVSRAGIDEKYGVMSKPRSERNLRNG